MKFASSVDAAARRRRAGRAATLTAALVCAGLACGLATGCGQKGPLSLPKASSSGAAPAAPASGAAR